MYEKLKEEFPIILTATAVALLASSIHSVSLYSFPETLRTAGLSLLYSFVAIMIIYFFFWISYTLHRRRDKIKEKIAARRR